MQEESPVPEDCAWANEEARRVVSNIGLESGLLDVVAIKMGCIAGEELLIKGFYGDERACQIPPEKSAFYIFYENLAAIQARRPFTPFEQTIMREHYVAPAQLHPNS